MDSADLLVCIGEGATAVQVAASLLPAPPAPTTSSPPSTTSLPTSTSTPILVLPDAALVEDQAKDLVMAALRGELPLVKRQKLEVVVMNKEETVTAMALDEVVVSRGGSPRPLQVSILPPFFDSQEPHSQAELAAFIVNVHL